MKNTKLVKQMFRGHLRSIIYAGISLLLVAVGLLPLAVSRQASAAQITGRSLTIGSGVPSATTTYAFAFTLPSATVVKSFSAQACTTAVGTCSSPPAGFSVTGSTLTAQPTGMGAASGWTVSTATAGSLRMSDSSNSTAPSGSQTVGFSGVTNPSTANTAFFLRMTTYSDAAWTTAIDTGTTASAVVQTLTVNAAVAEILNFCVGSTTVDDATTSVAPDCTTVAGNSVNLGTLDPSSINYTMPASSNCTAGDCGKNAVAMLRTNASGGATVSYDSVQQAGTNHKGTLRISGATCSASVVSTDQCINASSSQATFTAGTEDFGMTIAGVNCGSTTSYTCNFSTSTYNLVPQTGYIGDSTTAYGDTSGFIWDDTGATHVIASSAGSTSKVVDDEALILKFAATPAITTPFGVYTAQSDFIAVPAY